LKKYILILFYILSTVILIIGCQTKDGTTTKYLNTFNEGQKIAKENGYSLKKDKSEYDLELDIKDEHVFSMIVSSCKEGGYDEDIIEKNKNNFKISTYQLNEHSKFNDGIVTLSLIVSENNSIIGAFLNYEGYTPSITSVKFTENLIKK